MIFLFFFLWLGGLEEMGRIRKDWEVLANFFQGVGMNGKECEALVNTGKDCPFLGGGLRRNVKN